MRLKQNHQMSDYLIKIKNPDVRNIFMRLRNNLHILNANFINVNNKDNLNCPHCLVNSAVSEWVMTDYTLTSALFTSPRC